MPTSADGKPVLRLRMKRDRRAKQARRRHKDMAVLYMSGYTPYSTIRPDRLDDGIPLLQKPFRRAQLANAVREALDDTPT